MMNFFKIGLPWLLLKPGKYCSASTIKSNTLQGPGSSNGFHLQPSKARTAKQSLNLKLYPAALLWSICETRKRCKRPSAKRAPGRQMSRLFRAHFPADVSPGQEERTMFWFKDKLPIFECNYLDDSIITRDNWILDGWFGYKIQTIVYQKYVIYFKLKLAKKLA